MAVKIDIPEDATPLDIMRAVASSDPDPHRRWEVVGDMLILMPSPKDRHGRVQTRIGRKIGDSYDDYDGDPQDAWLVDLDGGILEVRHLQGGTYTTHATHSLREPFCADPFQDAGFAPADFPA